MDNFCTMLVQIYMFAFVIYTVHSLENQHMVDKVLLIRKIEVPRRKIGVDHHKNQDHDQLKFLHQTLLQYLYEQNLKIRQKYN